MVSQKFNKSKMNTQLKRAKAAARSASVAQKNELLSRIAMQMVGAYPARYGRMRLTSIDNKMSIQYDGFTGNKLIEK